MSDIAFFNGEWLPASEIVIPINDRGFLYADAIFETARLHRGRFFRLRHHLERLHASAQLLSIEAPPIAELERILEETARRAGHADASLRLILTAGAGGRGLSRKGAGPPNLLVTISPVASDWRESAARGWRVFTASTRRPPESSVPARLKATGRPYALLAFFEAEAAGFDDALMLSADGLIAEGTTWNVFWRDGNTLCTPALDVGILEGVTRSIILEMAAREGLRTREVRMPRSELDHVDEVFATMTSRGIVPFAALDGRPFTSSADSLAARLQQAYWTLVDNELAQTE